MCAVNIDMESYGGRNGFTMDKWINYPTAWSMPPRDVKLDYLEFIGAYYYLIIVAYFVNLFGILKSNILYYQSV
jgi:hypothetical protein